MAFIAASEEYRDRFLSISLASGWLTTAAGTEPLAFEIRLGADGHEEWMTHIEGRQMTATCAENFLSDLPEPCSIAVERLGIVETATQWRAVPIALIYSPATPESDGEPRYSIRMDWDGHRYETDEADQPLGAAFMLDRMLRQSDAGRFRYCGRCRWAREVNLRSARFGFDLRCFRDDQDGFAKIISRQRLERPFPSYGVYYVDVFHGCHAWEAEPGYDEFVIEMPTS